MKESERRDIYRRKKVSGKFNHWNRVVVLKFKNQPFLQDFYKFQPAIFDRIAIGPNSIKARDFNKPGPVFQHTCEKSGKILILALRAYLTTDYPSRPAAATKEGKKGGRVEGEKMKKNYKLKKNGSHFRVSEMLFKRGFPGCDQKILAKKTRN